VCAVVRVRCVCVTGRGQWNEIAQDEHIYKQMTRRCFPGAYASLRTANRTPAQDETSPQGGWKSFYLTLRTFPPSSSFPHVQRSSSTSAPAQYVSHREHHEGLGAGVLRRLRRGVVAIRSVVLGVPGGPAVPAAAQSRAQGARHATAPYAPGFGQRAPGILRSWLVTG
jgi:hypothetical protein